MSSLKLLQGVDMQGLHLKNRMAMAPLTRARATEEGIATDLMVEYYKQRAGAGLVITEASGISKQGASWWCAAHCFTDEMAEAWKKVVDAVHAKGGVISLQLWHMGRQSHSDVTGEPIVSASDVKMKGKISTKNGEKKDAETPVPLTKEGIKALVQDYKKAAENAKKAGFDLVEVHGANGYLLDQFFQTCTNKRDDEYGGSIENRLRIMDEVLDAVTEVYPPSRVGFRLSPNGAFGEMGSPDNIETFTAAIKKLGDRQLGYVHMLDGLGFGFHELTEPFTLKMAREILNTTKGAQKTLLMGNVGYVKDTAEEAVQTHADMIAFGRLFISNPDLPERFAQDAPLNPDAEYEHWWKPSMGARGYTDWPTLTVQA